jgi:photosystem II stability/assembly factor-like uncharacterized protein
LDLHDCCIFASIFTIVFIAILLLQFTLQSFDYSILYQLHISHYKNLHKLKALQTLLRLSIEQNKNIKMKYNNKQLNLSLYLSVFIALLSITSCCKKTVSTTTKPIDNFETPATTYTENITDISFATDNDGLICGEFGFCAKTNDGGQTWTKLNPSVNFSFTSAFMLDKNNLFVARNGLYNSVNAGSSFLEKGTLSQSQSMIPCIKFLDVNNGFVSHAGSIKKTTDGGLTWTEKYSTGLYYGLNNLQFTSNSVGYASGGRNFDQTNEGQIVKTIDGGETWNKILSNTNLTSINFIDNQTGFYSTFNKKIFKTTDGGNTWQKISSLTYLPLSIVFKTNLLGFVATQEGKILKTTDGGATWQIVYEKTTDPIAKIIATSNAVFAVGNAGLILKLKL